MHHRHNITINIIVIIVKVIVVIIFIIIIFIFLKSLNFMIDFISPLVYKKLILVKMEKFPNNILNVHL